jgi:hypothetical protein
MKCPVCFEEFEQEPASGQRFPEVCAACNEAFGPPPPEADPLPQKTAEQDREHLIAAPGNSWYFATVTAC